MFAQLTNYKKVDVVIALIVLFSVLGIADAGYLTYSHFTNTDVFCNVLNECDVVLTSEYSKLFGIPVALFGFLYYLTIFLIFFTASLYKDERKNKFAKKGFYLSILGLLASVYFVFLQLFILKALCLYCMVSAILSTLIFITSIVGYLSIKNPLPDQSHDLETHHS